MRAGQRRIRAVGIHADRQPLLTVDKPRRLRVSVRTHAPATPLPVRPGIEGETDAKGWPEGGGYIRMPAARFANTRRALLFCQRESNRSSVHISWSSDAPPPPPNPYSALPLPAEFSTPPSRQTLHPVPFLLPSFIYLQFYNRPSEFLRRLRFWVKVNAFG